jgi:Skp family chaperone for outer membrane proteins
MIARIGLALVILTTAAHAQDVPGIEICTVDKTMERRTSCLQSNVEFLVKTINRMKNDHDQRLGAANREIAALKTGLADLQKAVTDLQATKPKGGEAAKQPVPPAAPSGAAK